MMDWQGRKIWCETLVQVGTGSSSTCEKCRQMPTYTPLQACEIAGKYQGISDTEREENIPTWPCIMQQAASTKQEAKQARTKLHYSTRPNGICRFRFVPWT